MSDRDQEIWNACYATRRAAAVLRDAANELSDIAESLMETADGEWGSKWEYLTIRTRNALQSHGVTAARVSQMTDAEILEIPGIGKKGARELRDWIEAEGDQK